MERNENQSKVVLDEDQMATLSSALLIATEYMHAEARIAQAMGHDPSHFTAHARKYEELFAYSPEVVRVAVTIEAPSLASLRVVE